MELFTSVQNSTANILAGKSYQEDLGPSILFFAIVDPTQCDGKSQDTQELKKKIITYIRFDTEVSDERQVQQLGLVEGLDEFALKFLGSPEGGKLSDIETDKSRIVCGQFEQDVHFVSGFQFAQVGSKFTGRGLASPEYLAHELVLGYKRWYLNYGSLKESYYRKDFIKSWWQTWLTNRFEFRTSFSMNDKGFLNLLEGKRVSSVEVTEDLRKKIHDEMAQLIRSEPDLVDAFVINSNWTPSKNYGLIYSNDKSVISSQSLKDLAEYLERLDFDFGLSTYALKSTNLPSLKTYLTNMREMNSISNEGQLNERSLMEPAIYLQEQLTTHVFNPFVTTLQTLGSHLPSLPDLNWWSNTPPSEASSVDPSVKESMETAAKSGKYLLGNVSGDEISNRKVFVEIDGHSVQVNLVLYEINGVLFVLLYKHESPFLTELAHYQSLREKLDRLYELYFERLVVQQLESLKKDFETRPNFYHVVYDRQRAVYATSFPEIPDEMEVRRLKVADNEAGGESRSQMINLNLNIVNYLFKDTRLLEFEDLEKVVKLGRNWWMLVQYEGPRVVMVMKRFNQKDIDFGSEDLLASFGADVSSWYSKFSL